MKIKKNKGGRPPVHGKTMDKNTMVRMFSSEWQVFQSEALKLSKQTGLRVSVGAWLRLAAREKAERNGVKFQ